MDEVNDPDGPLSESEGQQFRNLLRRYCLHELDQWEAVKTEAPNGSIYVLFGFAPPEGTTPEMFRPF